MTAASFFSNQYGVYDGPARRNLRERLERLTWAMDSALRVPGTNIRLGADALLGMVPVAGNLATTAVSAYLIAEAWRLGVPRGTIARMAANVALDSVVSSVPVLGTVADVFWKANRKNMALLAEHIDRTGPGAGASKAGSGRTGASTVIDGDWRRMS
ncbi:DUF4112 domain-containing protein [Azospirillum sp. SYSU D00513]|uniref:DUF4112 domain-containing protein n=1 Tax=Azospirillum sp. SYSU D00513 TaxID=2812561 RepID=UPI0032B5713B